MLGLKNPLFSHQYWKSESVKQTEKLEAAVGLYFSWLALHAKTTFCALCIVRMHYVLSKNYLTLQYNTIQYNEGI